MTNRIWQARPVFLLLIVISIAHAQNPKVSDQPPDIGGKWSGTWSTYSPAQGAVPAKEICKSLDCEVVYKDGAWEATFEGD